MKRRKRKYKLRMNRADLGSMPEALNQPRALSPQMFGGIQGALPWANGMLYWPTLDDASEMDDYDRAAVMRAARYLYKNSGVIRKAVRDIWLLQGCLMPIPTTQDRDWNRKARAAFLARVASPAAFDVTGKLSWKTMQAWAERKTSIDGDCLCVLARGLDGGGMVAWYSAPKIITPPGLGKEDGWNQGVKTNAQGRPVAYGLETAPGRCIVIPAGCAILYQRDPDPAVPRGESDLIHAIRHGVDIAEIHGFTKASVKLSAAVGFVETKTEADKAPGMAAAIGGKKKPGCDEKPENPAQSFEVVTGGGARVVSLAPGRDLKAIYDQRPSPNVAAFIRDLLAEIAYGVGLDAEVLYDINTLGSAAARLILSKLRRWIDERKDAREVYMNRIYRHVLALEMEAGRLPRCKDPAWENVAWVGQRDLTIDLGREGGLAINLIREGLADADRWTLATEGMTAESILDRRADLLRRAHEIAESSGIPITELLPGAIGSTHAAHDVHPGPPPEDDEPENAGNGEKSKRDGGKNI